LFFLWFVRNGKLSMAESLRESTYRLIRTRALSGRLKPGSRVSEVALAKELGISRGPIREAMGHLVQEGLLIHIPQQGAFVRKPSRAELEDLYQVRRWIESGAASEAARHIGPVEIAKLESAIAEGRAAALARREAGDGKNEDGLLFRCTRADVTFHMTLIQVSGNRLAMKLISDQHILSTVWASLPAVSASLAVLAGSYRDHARILRRVRSGDAEGAAQAMAMHIRRGMELALWWFDLSQRQQAAGQEPFERWPESVVAFTRQQEDEHE
jgi:DNA-binding GntR family transcriptional regulator